MVQIGKNCIIHETATIENSIIGDNCIIKAGARIGQDGFNLEYSKEQNIIIKPKQSGLVIIGNNVEIGCNTCIDRGSSTNTIIENSVKIDNLVQIGHDVQIKENTIICAQTGIAGFTVIGKNCIIAGQVGIAGHLTIGNNVQIAGKSGVISNVKDNEIIGGYPSMHFKSWLRLSAILKKMIL